MTEFGQRLLAIAMKKAVELEVFPKHGDMDTTYLHWNRMEKILYAVFSEYGGENPFERGEGR